MSLQGTVKIFNAGKGFGFITATDGTDVFCHISGVVDGKIPLKGDAVIFDCAESQMKPGQLQASNVSGGSGEKGSGKGTGADVGAVKTFNPDKGFGFIVGPDGSDVFLHIKAVIDGSTPQQGDNLQYDQEPNPAKPGQMRATNVSGGSGFGGNNNGGKGKDNAKGESWGGKGDSWDGGYGAADGWGKGEGKAGPYGGKDGGKGKGKMMAAMMQMMDGWGWGDDSWGGDGWGGKGESWGGKGAGGKGDGFGNGKGDGYGFGKGKMDVGCGGLF